MKRITDRNIESHLTPPCCVMCCDSQVNRHNRGSHASEVSDEDDASVEGEDAGPFSEETDGSGADEDEGGREREAQPFDEQHHFNKKYSGVAHVDYFRPSPGGLTHLPQQRRYEPVTPAPIRPYQPSAPYRYQHQHEAAHHVPYYQKHQRNEEDSRPVNRVDVGYQRAFDVDRSDGERHRGDGRFAADSYSNEDAALEKKRNSYRRGQANNASINSS